MSLSEEDQLLYNAIQFLLDGKEDQAAALLVRCNLVIAGGEEYFALDGDGSATGLDIVVSCSRAEYEILCDEGHPIRKSVVAALEAVMTTNNFLRSLGASAATPDLSAEWRSQLRTSVSNQGTLVNRGKVWENLRFNNESELRIAKALDAAGVLFFPLCKGRLGPAGNRQNREPDFLVCSKGKWGILEVDGDDSHPPSRTYQDHERDRLFQQYGIRVVHHFQSLKCHDAPQAVVKEFLILLERNG